jgi:hypothetical protein
MVPISLSDIAQLIDVGASTVQRRIKASQLPPCEGKRKWNSAEAIRVALKIDLETDEVTLRKRKLMAEVEKGEIEVQKARGDVISMDMVCGRVERAAGNLRQRLLSIPNKAAKPCSFMESPSEIQEFIEAQIIEALEEIAIDRIMPELADRTSVPQSTETATET